MRSAPVPEQVEGGRHADPKTRIPAGERRCTSDVAGPRQGINIALRDVIVAANRLVPAAASGDLEEVDAACRAVEAERLPEIVRAQRLQRREARGQGDARAGSWRYALARYGARLLGRYRWAQRAWLARQHDLRFGSMAVELTCDARGCRGRRRVTSTGLTGDARGARGRRRAVGRWAHVPTWVAATDGACALRSDARCSRRRRSCRDVEP